MMVRSGFFTSGSSSGSTSTEGSSPIFHELSKTILVITQYRPSSISLALGTRFSPLSISTRIIANADVPISYVYCPANGVEPSACFSVSRVITSRSPTILQLLLSTALVLSSSSLLSSTATSIKRSIPVDVGQATIPFFDDETCCISVRAISDSIFGVCAVSAGFVSSIDEVVSSDDVSSSSFRSVEIPTKTRTIITAHPINFAIVGSVQAHNPGCTVSRCLNLLHGERSVK